eukprot:4683390-Prymnesium_polylepis.1
MHAPHAATRCAALRPAHSQPRPRLDVRGRVQPSNPPAPSRQPDMHGATPPRRSMPMRAPIALPIRPPDDDRTPAKREAGEALKFVVIRVNRRRSG